ncbi:MAG: iron(III) transport system substrate-binding protein [Alphaproteobacteria bacterium]|jgi:iron(III) transport system substrate-binding protein
MMTASISRFGGATLAAAALTTMTLFGAGTAGAADLPVATKAMLAKIKMSESVLKGLDEELKVPQAWIDGAKKEGKAIYYGTFGASEWPEFIAPFKARYPYINIDHQRASRMGRVDKPLIAFKQGRVMADLIAAIGGQLKGFKEAGALLDLNEIPNFKRASKDMRAKDGSWVGEKVKYWCMAYNTTLVKKSDLPKTWDDLLTNKVFHNKKIGVTDRPHNWILPLWTDKGADYARNYITRFFNDVKPQLRKEGARAVVTLAIAGEFHVALPATDYRVAGYAAKGAPIGWHCPEPAPVTVSELVIIKGSPAPNAAKIFVNWFLSKEGQIAQFATTGGSGVHKDLQDAGFSVYPDAVRGKKIALRTADSLVTDFTLTLRAWRAGWKAAGGKVDAPADKVATTLTKIERGGRMISFKVGGTTHKAKISGSRSQIVVGGKAVRRNKLKVGLACDVTYSGDGSEAKIISCK